MATDTETCANEDGGSFSPFQVAAGPDGAVFVASEDLLEVDRDGGVTTVVTTAVTGMAMGVRVIATDPSGEMIFVTGGYEDQIFKIVGSNLVIVAGDGAKSCDDSKADGGGGFLAIPAMAVDAQSNVFVPDRDLDGVLPCTVVQKVDSAGAITTVAGNGANGFHDGPGSEAEFSGPSGIAVDENGNLYIADTFNVRIRKVAPDGTTTTLAGNGTTGFDDGTGGENGTATFGYPLGVAVDRAGFVYVADALNNSIRRVGPDGTTITLAGDGKRGTVDGTLQEAEFAGASAIAIGPDGSIYVADQCRLRVIRLTE